MTNSCTEHGVMCVSTAPSEESRALSPNSRLRPPPALSVSFAVPPMMMSFAPPATIVSAPPRLVAATSDETMSMSCASSAGSGR